MSLNPDSHLRQKTLDSYLESSLDGFYSSGSEEDLKSLNLAKSDRDCLIPNRKKNTFDTYSEKSVDGFYSSSNDEDIKSISLGDSDSYSSDDIDDSMGDFIVSDESDSEDGEYFPPKLISCKKGLQNNTLIIDKTDEIKNISLKTIIGRTKESDLVIRHLVSNKRSLLIGKEHVGKMSVIKKALKERFCDTQTKIYVINCHDLLFRYDQDGNMKTLMKELGRLNHLKLKKIFVLKDVDRLFTKDECSYFLPGFLKTFPLCIATVTGETQPESSQRAVRALKRFRFEPIRIKECSIEEAKTITEQLISKETLPGGVSISSNVLDKALILSSHYLKRSTFPLKAVDLIRQAAFVALQLKKKSISVADLSQVIEDKTGKPKEHVGQTDVDRVISLKRELQDRVVGQDHAISMMTNILETRLLGFGDKNKPNGIFMVFGPTGVGKTKFAIDLAKLAFNENLIFVDMSQFKDEYSAASLSGAAPGLVGYEEGVPFVNQLIKKPHSVVLFDEIEKAHPQVLTVLLRAFNEGYLEDTKGRKCSFSDATVIMTSNLGSKELLKLKDNRHESVLNLVKPLAVEKLSPEFCNRITAFVPFKMLHKDDYAKVVTVHLNEIKEEYEKDKGFQLNWNQSVVKYFAGQTIDNTEGMRGLCNKLREEVDQALKNQKVKLRNELKGHICLSVMKNKLCVKQPRRSRRGRTKK